MRALATLLLLPLLPACRGSEPASLEASGRERSWEYPTSPAGDHVDTYHGVAVPDPFRWLEDSDTDKTREWIEAQNALTFSYLAEIPARERIRERLEELWDYERYETPVKRGGRYFYRRNDGLQNQSVLLVAENLEDEGRVLLDPNELSEDGTVALSDVAPSPDGRHLAYGLSDGGSDWRIWKVRDVATGEDLADVVRWNKFGGVEWAADSSGFYYSRYDRPTEGDELQQRNAPPDVCFHRVGADPEEEADALVLRRPEREGVSQGFSLTEDGSALVVTRWEARTWNTEIDYLSLRPRIEQVVGSLARPIVAGFDAQYRVVGDDGDVLFVRTNLDAPRWRVIAIDPDDAAPENWREVIPESDEPIEAVTTVGGHLVVQYLRHATSEVRVHTFDGELVRRVALPEMGTVGGFEGEPDDPETFYSFASFLRPTTIYRHDVATGESEVFRAPQLGFDPSRYVTRQIFYTSADGTRVPMFLTHRSDVTPDGEVPTYLYGYGGFEVSLTPFFSVSNLVWMEMGGMLAVPNIRGGGEYGEEWHWAGTKEKKQNVFDDFIAAAEWLVEEGWTRPERLAIGGGSNGGLLVGACMTQRPELFGATLPAVGVLDMLRYHEFTIGWAWAGDYGTSEDPAEFQALHAYSPLHNLQAGTAYPATLITTADHDDRVVPAHSFKFAAALQAAQAGRDPTLIRIETRAGHGGGKPTAMQIEEAADRWAFLVRELGVTVP